jgi:hypothetical protein
MQRVLTWQNHGALKGVQKISAEERLALEPGFNQMRIHLMGHAQLANIWATERAHNDINAPGTMPKTKTKSPLMDKTTRTSASAVTVVAVTASSKYMTLTTRK